jgi:3D (Asp-Asp-Asp) domain-containing protein
MAQPGEHFQLARPQQGDRLYVWDPEAKNYAYILAADVGPANKPSKPARQPETVAKPEPTLAPAPSVAGPAANVFWAGTARVTMYTCVELGGCNRTASGIWPYEGVVAVDPRIIPLGSMVWIDGLGHFLAADTGSAILGNRIDVYSLSYPRAIQWGVQYRSAAAYRE